MATALAKARPGSYVDTTGATAAARGIVELVIHQGLDRPAVPIAADAISDLDARRAVQLPRRPLKLGQRWQLARPITSGNNSLSGLLTKTAWMRGVEIVIEPDFSSGVDGVLGCGLIGGIAWLDEPGLVGVDRELHAVAEF